MARLCGFQIVPFNVQSPYLHVLSGTTPFFWSKFKENTVSLIQREFNDMRGSQKEEQGVIDEKREVHDRNTKL